MQQNIKYLPYLLIAFEAGVYLSMDMYIPCLPILARDFGVDQDYAQYTVTVWFLGLLFLQLIIGPLSDKFGRRKIVVFGIFIYILGSFICSVTHIFSLFMVARFIQGASAAVPLIVGYAAIHESFDNKTAMKLLAIMGSIVVLAPALGPLMGALIIYYFDWRLTFWILTIFSSITMLMIYYKFPETSKERHPLLIKKVMHGYTSILKNKRFLSFAVPMALALASLVIWIIGIPFVVAEYYKYSVIVLGILQLIVFSSFIVGARFLKMLLDKYSPTHVLKIGFSVATLGSVLLLLLAYLVPQYIFVITIGMVISGFGLSFCFGPSNRMAIASDNSPMGYRTAVYSIVQNFFMVFGTVLYTFVNSITILNLASCVVVGSILSLMLARRYQRGTGAALEEINTTQA